MLFLPLNFFHHHVCIFVLRCQIRARDGQLFIVLRPHDADYPPFRIVNKTYTDSFRFCQKDVSCFISAGPQAAVPYAWDVPTMAETDEKQIALILNEGRDQEYFFSLEEDRIFDPIVLSQPAHTLFPYIKQEGPTKVCPLHLSLTYSSVDILASFSS